MRTLKPSMKFEYQFRFKELITNRTKVYNAI